MGGAAVGSGGPDKKSDRIASLAGDGVSIRATGRAGSTVFTMYQSRNLLTQTAEPASSRDVGHSAGLTCRPRSSSAR